MEQGVFYQERSFFFNIDHEDVFSVYWMKNRNPMWAWLNGRAKALENLGISF